MLYYLILIFFPLQVPDSDSLVIVPRSGAVVYVRLLLGVQSGAKLGLCEIVAERLRVRNLDAAISYLHTADWRRDPQSALAATTAIVEYLLR